MSRWDENEAKAIAETIARSAKRWKQIPPPSTAMSGYRWECNACAFATPHTGSAEDHAVTMTRTRPFAHVMLERSPDPKARARRRIHSPDGRTVRCEERAGSRAS